MIKIISGTYGNNRPGQLYSYLTDKETKTGDRVLVQATHWKSGEEFNTLITVRQTTQKITNALLTFLSGVDNLKWVGGGPMADGELATSIRDLPGYEPNSWDWSGDRDSGEVRDQSFRIVTRDGQRFAERAGSRQVDRMT